MSLVHLLYLLVLTIRFLYRDLGSSRSGIVKLRNDKLPAVASTDPWDGKDGEVRVKNVTS